MAFRSVNLNPPRGPRGGGGGRGGGSGNRYASNNSGYNTPPLRIDASGRVDQGFGPVGGAAAASDPDFDIFGIDEPSTLQAQQAQQQSAPNPQPILYVPSPCSLRSVRTLVVLRSMKCLSFYYSKSLILNVPNFTILNPFFSVFRQYQSDTVI